jgi:HEAT repeat protein
MVTVQRRDVIPEEREERRAYDVDLLISERNVDGLIGALQSEDALTRERAALALGSMRDPRATEPLIRALGDPVQGVRENAANALAYIGPPAVTPLIDLLESPERQEWYAQPMSRFEEGGLAQHSLLGGPEGVTAEDREAFRGEPITQHDMLGGPTDVGTKKTLRHGVLAQHDLLGGPEGVRGYEALHRPARELVVPGTTWETDVERRTRRVYAAIILGEIADPRARDPLERALNDEDPAVRRAAEDGLARLRAQQGTAASLPPA